MSRISPDIALAPGFLPAASAVCALLEGGMPAADVDRIVALALAVARPYVQAEFLADLSDELEKLGHREVAFLLDYTGFTMRAALDGR